MQVIQLPWLLFLMTDFATAFFNSIEKGTSISRQPSPFKDPYLFSFRDEPPHVKQLSQTFTIPSLYFPWFRKGLVLLCFCKVRKQRCPYAQKQLLHPFRNESIYIYHSFCLKYCLFYYDSFYHQIYLKYDFYIFIIFLIKLMIKRC